MTEVQDKDKAKPKLTFIPASPGFALLEFFEHWRNDYVEHPIVAWGVSEDGYVCKAVTWVAFEPEGKEWAIKYPDGTTMCWHAVNLRMWTPKDWVLNVKDWRKEEAEWEAEDDQDMKEPKPTHVLVMSPKWPALTAKKTEASLCARFGADLVAATTYTCNLGGSGSRSLSRLIRNLIGKDYARELGRELTPAQVASAARVCRHPDTWSSNRRASDRNDPQPVYLRSQTRASDAQKRR